MVKILCDHARCGSAALRLNALWALKHLVTSASVELKKTCLEELQPGWLMQLICDDADNDAENDAAPSSSSGRPGAEDLDGDVDMGVGEDQPPARPWLSGSFYRSPHALQDADERLLRLAESRLAALREAEQSQARRARHDELAIQEQALGFIRNLVTHAGNGSESAGDAADMIDFLFHAVGQERFFEALAAKLRVRVRPPFSRRQRRAETPARVLHPQAKTTEEVIYILVHVAASVPRHRQLVMAQTDLLRLLAQLFASQDTSVRVALCHLINNLTWQDDGGDAHACSQRAVELRKLGFLAKLEMLGQADDDLDVRERARSALWQLKNNY